MPTPLKKKGRKEDAVAFRKTSCTRGKDPKFLKMRGESFSERPRGGKEKGGRGCFGSKRGGGGGTVVDRGQEKGGPPLYGGRKKKKVKRKGDQDPNQRRKKRKVERSLKKGGKEGKGKPLSYEKTPLNPAAVKGKEKEKGRPLLAAGRKKGEEGEGGSPCIRGET